MHAPRAATSARPVYPSFLMRAQAGGQHLIHMRIVRSIRKSPVVRLLLAVALALLVEDGLAIAQSMTLNRGTSEALTRYLRANKLPLVGAQVSDLEGGSHQVVLYGFVASDFGKTDAESKARQFLGDPKAQMVNRIKVDPAIAHLEQRSTRPSGQGSPATAPADEWADVMQHILQNGALVPPSSGGINSFPGAP